MSITSSSSTDGAVQGGLVPAEPARTHGPHAAPYLMGGGAGNKECPEAANEECMSCPVYDGIYTVARLLMTLSGPCCEVAFIAAPPPRGRAAGCDAPCSPPGPRLAQREMGLLLANLIDGALLLTNQLQQTCSADMRLAARSTLRGSVSEATWVG